MEFLRSLLRRRFARGQLATSRTVGCFLRLLVTRCRETVVTASGLETGFKIKRKIQINERITRCHAIGFCLEKKIDINSLLAITWAKTQSAARRLQLGNCSQAPGQCKVVFNTYHRKPGNFEEQLQLIYSLKLYTLLTCLSN